MHEMDQKKELLLKALDLNHPMAKQLHDGPEDEVRTVPKTQINQTLNALSDKSVNTIIRHHLHSFRSPAKERSHHGL